MTNSTGNIMRLDRSSVSVAQAKARLSEILARVESGEEVVITRRGKAVARICPEHRPKKVLDLRAIDRVRGSLPRAKVSSAELIRQLRNEGF
jgi:prevent-host-death family protein